MLILYKNMWPRNITRLQLQVTFFSPFSLKNAGFMHTVYSDIPYIQSAYSDTDQYTLHVTTNVCTLSHCNGISKAKAQAASKTKRT